MSITTKTAEPIVILTRSEIAKLVSLSEYVTAVERAFRLHEEQKALSPGVLAVPAHGGTFHIKAAGLELARTYIAVKVNGNFPRNRSEHGLPTIQGSIILCDGRNGSPLAFMDSIEITINRTAGATAVAARHLARPESSVATICGCGDQSDAQLTALKQVLPLCHVYAFDLDFDRARLFSTKMAAKLDVEATPVKTLDKAARESDVIITCTTARHYFLERSHVSPGTFIAAVGADSHDKQELEPALLASSTVVVDLLEQCAQIGDLHHALVAGCMRKTDVYAELGEIVTGKKRGRTEQGEITIFDSTGTAIQDVAAAAVAYERAQAIGAGHRCDLASVLR